MTENDEIISILESVTDPEVPVLTILDLGVVRTVEEQEDGVVVTLTPTYSGCPAMKVIEEDIEEAFSKSKYRLKEIITVLSPAWTTDWLSENGKLKLKEYGIAPPVKDSPDKSFLFAEPKVIPCPKCNSKETKLVSQFGSTACKALYTCESCKEPFDYFKCL